MSVLPAVLAALDSGAVEVVDLTTPLQESTPILQLPPPLANTSPFRLEELSRYDDRGPAWYWNDIHTGEHTGTHLDAPIHWVTGKDGLDVSQAPLRPPEGCHIALGHHIAQPGGLRPEQAPQIVQALQWRVDEIDPGTSVRVEVHSITVDDTRPGWWIYVACPEQDVANESAQPADRGHRR